MVGTSGMDFMANAEDLSHGPMIDIYGRICQNEAAEYKEGDAMSPVDLCIIYFGTDDWIGGGMVGKDAQAMEGYKKVIDIVRSRHGPSVPIPFLFPDACSVVGAPNLTKCSRIIQTGFHVNVKRWVTDAVALGRQGRQDLCLSIQRSQSRPVATTTLG